jgi:glycosyltransferase involved in cell wall biosynthesis
MVSKNYNWETVWNEYTKLFDRLTKWKF